MHVNSDFQLSDLALAKCDVHTYYIRTCTVPVDGGGWDGMVVVMMVAGVDDVDSERFINMICLKPHINNTIPAHR